jgi:hypothetical protein
MEKVLALNNFFLPSFSKNKFRVSAKTANPNFRSVLALTLVVANVLLLGSYIYGVNKFAAKGYEIKKLQIQLSALTEDNKKINLKVSEANSMVGIQSEFLNSNFVAAGTSKFLEISPLSGQYSFAGLSAK